MAAGASRRPTIGRLPTGSYARCWRRYCRAPTSSAWRSSARGSHGRSRACCRRVSRRCCASRRRGCRRPRRPTRHGCEVVVAAGAGCCGALVHHLGEEGPALAAARANIDAWLRVEKSGGLDAIVINASGCGTQIKDYGFMLRDDETHAVSAKRISGLARDVTELMSELELAPPVRTTGQRVAYHSACSMQHGQRIVGEPKALLARAGFIVLDVPEGHLCCGSAGTYNILQPALATRLRDRKIAHIESVRPDIIATGNIGCMTQLGAATKLPIVHTVELLDWATGGKLPAALGRTLLARS